MLHSLAGRAASQAARSHTKPVSAPLQAGTHTRHTPRRQRQLRGDGGGRGRVAAERGSSKSMSASKPVGLPAVGYFVVAGRQITGAYGRARGGRTWVLRAGRRQGAVVRERCAPETIGNTAGVPKPGRSYGTAPCTRLWSRFPYTRPSGGRRSRGSVAAGFAARSAALGPPSMGRGVVLALVSLSLLLVRPPLICGAPPLPVRERARDTHSRGVAAPAC